MKSLDKMKFMTFNFKAAFTGLHHTIIELEIFFACCRVNLSRNTLIYATRVTLKIMTSGKSRFRVSKSVDGCGRYILRDSMHK